MNKSSTNQSLIRWVYFFTFVVAFLVVFGGLVRLTRAGLSIVEWNPIFGAIPPLNHDQWVAEFNKYQSTPEFIHINHSITLEQYKTIFLLEWAHRFIARLAGLLFAVPFFYFFFTRKIPKSQLFSFVFMGLLFLTQAFMGWVMVSSGLIDKPFVNHHALAIHLALALILIGKGFWTALSLSSNITTTEIKWSRPAKAFGMVTALLFLEIVYGAFTAGLKAGHVSDTWPYMNGSLIPLGLFDQFPSILMNVLEAPLTVMFIHRWLSLGVLFATLLFFYVSRKQHFPRELRHGLSWFLGLIVFQIILGILVTVTQVNLAMALIHQANVVALFGCAILVLFRIKISSLS